MGRSEISKFCEIGEISGFDACMWMWVGKSRKGGGEKWMPGTEVPGFIRICYVLDMAICQNIPTHLKSVHLRRGG